MAYGAKLFGRMLPAGTHPDDREDLLRQLYLSIGAQLMSGAASGQNPGESLSGSLGQLAQLGPMARQMQDRRSQNEYYEQQRRHAELQEARASELHPLIIQGKKSDLEVAEGNRVETERARRDQFNKALIADEDIEIANQQRIGEVAAARSAIESVKKKLTPEQVMELNRRISLIESTPNEALTTANLRTEINSIYDDAEAYARGERQFNETVRRTREDDERLARGQEHTFGKEIYTRPANSQHWTVKDSSGRVIRYEPVDPEVLEGEANQAGAVSGARAAATAPYRNAQGQEITQQMVVTAARQARVDLAKALGLESPAQLTKEQQDEADEMARKNLGVDRQTYLSLAGTASSRLQEMLNGLASEFER